MSAEPGYMFDDVAKHVMIRALSLFLDNERPTSYEKFAAQNGIEMLDRY